MWSNAFTLFRRITFKLGKSPYFNALFTSSVHGYSPTALKQKPLEKKKQNRGRVYSRYVLVTNYNSVLLDSLTKWRAAGKIELSKRLVPFSYKEI